MKFIPKKKKKTENSEDIIDSLKILRLKYPQKSYNSSNKYQNKLIRNKFETLLSLITSEIDILMVS